MKYAVKIELSPNDWIYLTQDTGGNCWDLQPELFETISQANDFISKLRLKNATTVIYTEK